MSYASLMVYVEGESERIRLAVDLAARFQASLVGVAARAPVPVVTGEDAAIDVGLLERENADVRSFLDKAGEQFRIVTYTCQTPLERRFGTGKAKLSFEWRSAPDFPNDFVAREARAADLVIVGQTSTTPYRSLDVGSLLLNAGRPVLVVPGVVSSLPSRRAVVAWKDTREARRAVHDAMPFLRAAENVFLVEVCEWGAEARALQHLKDVGRFLAHHHITNVTERVLPDEPIAGDVLLRFVRDENADLIVSGAYGHSRLGEWIFGGVTRELLTKSPVCCLFSH